MAVVKKNPETIQYVDIVSKVLNENNIYSEKDSVYNSSIEINRCTNNPF